jgi:hypothetical protein
VSQNTISRMHLKMAAALGTVPTQGTGRWPIGPKLVVDQMAARVPEIINSYLYLSPPPTYLRTESYPVSETLCFLVLLEYRLVGKVQEPSNFEHLIS